MHSSCAWSVGFGLARSIRRHGRGSAPVLNSCVAALSTPPLCWWRAERKAFQIASAFGRGSRLSLDVLSELRLMLRLMRWKRMQAEFPAIVGALCDEPVAMAAE
jgi:hypothetical protein